MPKQMNRIEIDRRKIDNSSFFGICIRFFRQLFQQHLQSPIGRNFIDVQTVAVIFHHTISKGKYTVIRPIGNKMDSPFQQLVSTIRLTKKINVNVSYGTMGRYGIIERQSISFQYHRSNTVGREKNPPTSKGLEHSVCRLRPILLYYNVITKRLFHQTSLTLFGEYFVT